MKGTRNEMQAWRQHETCREPNQYATPNTTASIKTSRTKTSSRKNVGSVASTPTTNHVPENRHETAGSFADRKSIGPLGEARRQMHPQQFGAFVGQRFGTHCRWESRCTCPNTSEQTNKQTNKRTNKRAGCTMTHDEKGR